MKKIFFCILIILTVSVSSFAEFLITPTVGFSSFDLKKAKTTLPLGKEELTTSAEISWMPITAGLGIGRVGLTGFSFMWNNDFSFGGKFEKNFSFDTEKLKAVLPDEVSTADSVKVFDVATAEAKAKGFYWSSQLLFGYTLKLPIKLRLNFATGLDLGVGKSNIKIQDIKNLKNQNIEADLSQFNESRVMISAGIPLNLGLQYYFVKFLGINAEFEYIPSYSYVVTFSETTLRITAGGETKTKIQTIPLQSRGINHQIRFKIGPIFKL